MCTQAAPHVSGLLAYLIGRRMEGFEPETSPQVAKIRLQQIARRGVPVQGVRQYLDVYHKGTTQSPQASTHHISGISTRRNFTKNICMYICRIMVGHQLRYSRRIMHRLTTFNFQIFKLDQSLRQLC